MRTKYAVIRNTVIIVVIIIEISVSMLFSLAFVLTNNSKWLLPPCAFITSKMISFLFASPPLSLCLSVYGDAPNLNTICFTEKEI